MKTIYIIPFLIGGFVFGQKKAPLTITIPPKKDTIKINLSESNDRFYKNMTEEEADRYTILIATPDEKFYPNLNSPKNIIKVDKIEPILTPKNEMKKTPKNKEKKSK